MFKSYYLAYLIILIFNAFVIKYLSKYYALDIPNHRKQHSDSISQIGGLLFASVFLVIGFFLGIIPSWFLYGSVVSVILGLLDDYYSINWKFKLNPSPDFVVLCVSIVWCLSSISNPTPGSPSALQSAGSSILIGYSKHN